MNESTTKYTFTLAMYKDYLLSLGTGIVSQRIAEHLQLVVENILGRQTSGGIKQFLSMKVHNNNIIVMGKRRMLAFALALVVTITTHQLVALLLGRGLSLVVLAVPIHLTLQLLGVDHQRTSRLVVGNEGEGVSRLVREKCDFIASIPMKGDIDSLNASVAAGVLAYEIVRQRMN